MAAGALSTFRQLDYAFGIAILGEVFRGGLTHVAGPALAGPLGGGQAGEVMAQSDALSHLARQAFATGLDATFTVAAVFGLVAAILVFTWPGAPRPGRARQAPRRRNRRPPRTARGKTVVAHEIRWCAWPLPANHQNHVMPAHQGGSNTSCKAGTGVGPRISEP